MTKVEIVNCKPKHVKELANTMRYQDKKEIEMFGISHILGLWNSYIQSDINKSLMYGDEVAACFGCAPLLDGSGQPWLLTSSAIEKISPIKFAKLYKEEVKEMLTRFPVLENFVDPSYTKSVRLLEIVGFELGGLERHGKGLYQKFSISRGGV